MRSIALLLALLPTEGLTAEPFLGTWADAGPSDPKGYTRARNNLGPAITAASRRAYYANVTFIDEQVGRILQKRMVVGRNYPR